jgi:hypothetical protein
MLNSVLSFYNNFVIKMFAKSLTSLIRNKVDFHHVLKRIIGSIILTNLWRLFRVSNMRCASRQMFLGSKSILRSCLMQISFANDKATKAAKKNFS